MASNGAPGLEREQVGATNQQKLQKDVWENYRDYHLTGDIRKGLTVKDDGGVLIFLIYICRKP